LDTEFTVFF
jgi:hypothetical protein